MESHEIELEGKTYQVHKNLLFVVIHEIWRNCLLFQSIFKSDYFLNSNFKRYLSLFTGKNKTKQKISREYQLGFFCHLYILFSSSAIWQHCDLYKHIMQHQNKNLFPQKIVNSFKVGWYLFFLNFTYSHIISHNFS